MLIKELGENGILQRTSSETGLCLDVGPFCIRLKSNERTFIKNLSFLYEDFPVLKPDSFADFHININRPKGGRRFFKPQVVFFSDGQQPFEPFPRSYALPLFEWGLNWCIARRSHQYLMLHAAVVEKYGKALILPAIPGSGKSTLSAALALDGWRFLSDEFTIISPQNGQIIPIPRPTPLKNYSIQVIKQKYSQADLGPLFPKTRKGSVAHLKTPIESVQQLKKTATAGLVVFPEYREKSETEIHSVNEPYAIFKLASNAFNYELMGQKGFELISQIVSSCSSYNLSYSNLDHAIETLNGLICPGK